MKFFPTAEAASVALAQQCPALGEPALGVLARMYCATHLQGTEGVAEVGNTKIPVLEGAVLHRLVQMIGAKRTLEIGFAYGFSTVWLLAALPPGGRHVAIDPFELSHFAGVGLRQVEALALPEAFEWRQALSIHALSDAIRHGERYDLVFIDGNHRFDDVLVDFYLADQVLQVGGILALDDMWMPSVRTVVEFITTNRAYRPVQQPEGNLAVFQKYAEDQRDWRHHVPFAVHRA